MLAMKERYRTRSGSDGIKHSTKKGCVFRYLGYWIPSYRSGFCNKGLNYNQRSIETNAADRLASFDWLPISRPRLPQFAVD